MIRENDNTSRRTVLKTATTGIATLLAGCSSTGDGATSTEQEPAGSNGAEVIKSVQVAGKNLRVELVEGADVDSIDIIAPDGTELASKQISAGATAVDLDLIRHYAPGKYRVVGIRQREVVDETTIELDPEVEFKRVANAWKAAGSDPPEELRYQVLIEVQNNGNAPQKLEQLEFKGTPNPVKFSMEMKSGMLHHDDGVVIPPGEGVQLYSNSRPFDVDFDDAGLKCGQSGTMTIRFETITGEPVSAQYGIQVGEEQADESCPVTVGNQA